MALDGLHRNLQPNSPDAERAILGAILIDNAVFRQTAPLITTDFYALPNRRVFEAMLELDEEGRPLDVLLVVERLREKNALEICGGMAGISGLITGLPHKTNISAYVREVKNKAARREAIKKLDLLKSEAADESVPLKDLCASISQVESELRSEFAEQTDSFKPLSQILEQEVLPQLDAYFRREVSEFLIPTGFPQIDRVLGGGLYLSDMLAIVAPPKSAKSAFALQLARSTARGGETVGLLSLEMSNLQNGLRFIAQQSYADADRESNLNLAIEANHLRPGIYESTYERAKEVAAALFETNLYLCQKPLTWSEVQAETRRLVKEKNLRVLIVDYWQLVFNDNRGQNRTESLSEIAKGLKRLGQELNICVITLGQFNQDGLKQHAAGKELSTLYLEGSGELVKSANIVLTLDIKPADLYRPDAPRKGTMTFRPLRSGADAQLNCWFLGQFLTVEIEK